MEGQLLEKDGPLSNITTGISQKKDLAEKEETQGHVTCTDDQDGERSRSGNKEESGLETACF